MAEAGELSCPRPWHALCRGSALRHEPSRRSPCRARTELTCTWHNHIASAAKSAENSMVQVRAFGSELDHAPGGYSCGPTLNSTQASSKASSASLGIGRRG